MFIHDVDADGAWSKLLHLPGALARNESSALPQFRFAPGLPAPFMGGTRGILVPHGGFEPFAGKIAEFILGRGRDVTVHRQRDGDRPRRDGSGVNPSLGPVGERVTPPAKPAAALQHLHYFARNHVLLRCEALCVRGMESCKALAFLASLTLALLLTLPLVRARAEYLLGPGDKLEIQISSAFTRSATVNADGDIVMPRIGAILLAGLTLAAAQDRLQQAYRNEKVFQSAEVLIQVLEYRPFFMDGDIAKPGAYPYQPNITIRQAITLAGGLDMVRFHFGENPFIRAADLRADYETLAIERFKLELRRSSLEAELQGSHDVKFTDVDAIIVRQETVKDLVEIERQRFIQRYEAYEQQTALLKNVVKQAQDNLQTLKAEVELESAAAQQEERNAATEEAMVNRGVSPTVRLTEAKRDLATAKSRFYATDAEIASSERVLSEALLALNRSEVAHRSGLLSDMDATATALEKLAAQEKSAAEKFAVIGAARSALYAQPGDEASVAIYRRTDKRVEQIPATLDTDIVAGDVVSINLKPQRLLGPAAAPVAPRTQ